MSYLDTLLQGVEVEWKTLVTVFDIIAGGDVPKEAFSEIETEEFKIPILSNGIENKALYGWTNIPKINKSSLTISARGTIGWTSYRDKPFFPIVRLLVLTPKIELNTKFVS
jgi:type I restriction enzyme S subunit